MRHEQGRMHHSRVIEVIPLTLNNENLQFRSCVCESTSGHTSGSATTSEDNINIAQTMVVIIHVCMLVIGSNSVVNELSVASL